VFGKAKVAVFLDGCFWHGCAEHYRPARNNNPEFWEAKVETNRSRDRDTEQQLTAAGWTVLRFWEHDDPVWAARRVAEVVRSSVSTNSS
jgi:DNA mismatch endonuclease (patch repair protein)